jgi:translation initiation factor 5
MAKLIKEVVLCPNCSLPELIMTCEPKRKNITIKCDSCGRSQAFRKGNQKFLKFIGNNPPKLNIGVEAKNKKKGGPAAAQAAAEAEKKKADAEAAANGTPKRKEDQENGKAQENGGDDGQKGQVVEFDEDDVKATEKDLKRAEQEGVEWSTDISAEAMDNRRNELVPESIKQMVVAGVDSSGIERLRSLLAKEPSDEEVISQLKSLRSSNSIDVDEAVEAVFAHVYDSGEGMMKTTKAHLKLLKVLLNTETSQVAFLVQLEGSILENQGLLKQTTKYLKFLYDADLTEEQAVLKWYSLGSEEGELNAVKKKAKPFVEWLETADEESDEE